MSWFYSLPFKSIQDRRGASTPTPLPPGADLLLRASGITESGGAVTSWADEGSLGLTFTSPTVGEQPSTDSFGAVDGATFGVGDRINSTTDADFEMGLLAMFVLRIDDETQNGREIFRLSNFIHIEQTLGGRFTVEHAADDMITTTGVKRDEIVSLIVYWAPTGQTSFVELNGVQEDTAPGNSALDPASAPVYLASNAGGGADWHGGLLECAVYSGVTDISTFDLASLRARAAYVKAQAEGATTQVFIGLGQSNLDGTVNAPDFASVNGVDYTAAYPAVRLAKRPVAAWNALDDSGGTTGTGPEVAMGRELIDDGLDAGSRGVRLLVYGVGGTSVAVDWDPAGTGNTYDDAIAYIDARLAELPTPYEIAGFFFVNGESDGQDAGQTAAFQANLEALISALVTEYSAELASDYRIGITKLSDDQTAVPNRAGINSAIDDVAAANSRVYVVDTSVTGTVGPDNLHRDAGGHVGVGRAHARGMLTGSNQTIIDGDDGT